MIHNRLQPGWDSKTPRGKRPIFFLSSDSGITSSLGAVIVSPGGRKDKRKGGGVKEVCA